MPKKRYVINGWEIYVSSPMLLGGRSYWCVARPRIDARYYDMQRVAKQAARTRYYDTLREAKRAARTAVDGQLLGGLGIV